MSDVQDASSSKQFEDIDLHSNNSDDGEEPAYRYHGKYRETSLQYLPGRGAVRYSAALRNLIPVRSRQTKKREVLAVDDAGMFSFITFGWLSKYMTKAYRKGITMEDIPNIPPLDSCDYNAQRLEVMWHNEVAKNGPRAASLKLVIWRFIRTRVLVATFVLSFNIIFSFLSVSVIMRSLIEYAEVSEAPLSEGWKWAALLGASELLRLAFYAANFSIAYRTAIRLRAACMTMLYRKLIRLHSLGDKTVGELVNIFASDSQRLFSMVLLGPMIIYGPVSIIFSVLYILWVLSPWALLGMLVFVLFYPIQYGMSRVVGHYQAKAVSVTDKRISLTSEILSCIKLIKMYAWEKNFTNNLSDMRKRELKLLQTAMYFQSLTISVASTVPIVSAIVMFLSHIGMGYDLSPSQAFSAISLCLRILVPVMIFISESWKALIQGFIAVRRLQAFPVVSLCLKQLRNVLTNSREGWTKLIAGGITLDRLQAFTVIPLLTNVVLPCWLAWTESCRSLFRGIVSIHRIKSVMLLNEISPFIAKPMDKSQAVCISNGSFSWDSSPPSQTKVKSGKKVTKRTEDSAKHKKIKEIPADVDETATLNSVPKIESVLHGINFFVPKGSLVGVCGQVGAGKSSLLSAALGQLRLDSGKISREGSCAYVSQQAWILNATLKENILFGEAFNAKRYFHTLQCCALSDDINMLPGGDETEIGERGITLSGGQKQRVALARALYADRDIYFLDDPLSAVDAHVGTHIFNKYILDGLKHKSVIFVTHQIQYLNHCDVICVMKHGTIVERGTHEELLVQNGEYATMVRSWQQSQNSPTTPIDQISDLHSYGMNGNSLTPQDNVTFGDSESSQLNGTVKVQDKVAEGKTLTQAEHVQRGSLHLDTYLSYIRVAGGFCIFLGVLSIIFVNVGTTAFSSWWLAMWIKAGAGNSSIVQNKTVFVENETSFENVTVFGISMADNPDFEMYRLVYALTILAILSTNIIRGLVYAKVSLNAAKKLHNMLFKKVIKTSMQFFETTPLGRVQNLFSKDMDEVDTQLPFTLECMLEDGCFIILSFFFICLVFPWFIIPLTILGVLYFTISKVFRVAVRDLKRLENTSRSPIFSAVTATVQGLGTIHAFNKENEFINKFTKTFDQNSTCLSMSSSALRWLAVRIDFISVVVTLITAVMSVLLHNQVPPAMMGLAIAYAASVSGVFQFAIRMMAEAETRFISVERINSYLSSLKLEGGSGPKGKPWQGWPQRGTIHFNKVSLQYRSNLPLVLQDVTFKVKHAEKLGIVGRTGSGKSSLLTALFRLVELSSGTIEIDQLNIASLDLEQLRSQLTIIPQDPVLFSGSVRSNLDPGEQYTDDQLWAVLEQTQLKAKVAGLSGLATHLGAGGDGLSVGERQLLCLARALLRNTRILVLDEATASIDPETESALHKVIKEEFRDCTVMMIAHRLSSVLDCDRVLVMEDGKVMEFDKPAKLLEQPHSKFFQLIEASKKTNS